MLIHFWCFLDFLKSVLFELLGVVIHSWKFVLGVSFWILVQLNVLDLIKA